MNIDEEIALLQGSLAEQTPEQEPSATEEYLGEFYYGLGNLLGAPVDLTNTLLGVVGLDTDKPVGGSESIRDFFRSFTHIPAEGQKPAGIPQRAARMTGETVVPFSAMYSRGAALSTKAIDSLNDFQKALVYSYNKPVSATLSEGTAVAGGSTAGQLVYENYPDSVVAETMAELTAGIATPVAATKALQLIDITSGPSFIRNSFGEGAAKRRATRRVGSVAGSPSGAAAEAAEESVLDLPPMIRSGDAGLYSLQKSAMDTDPQLAQRVADKADAAAEQARAQVLQTGDPVATTHFLDNLRVKAAAESQAKILELKTDVSPVAASRELRTTVEAARKKAKAVESKMWRDAKYDGEVDMEGVFGSFERILANRERTDDPEDIASFLHTFLGGFNKKGQFKRGELKNNPTAGELKALRSRMGTATTAELAKDAPNRKKIAIFTELREEIYNSLESVNPEYANAVAYSRQFNERFTQGRVGKLLGYERAGGTAVSPEGSMDFLMSGNKDKVRTGIRQVKGGAPEAEQAMRNHVKAMFNTVAMDTRTGALLTERASRFLTQHSHILDEFPDIKRSIQESIRTQRITDDLYGGNIGDTVSRQIKNKSVVALYLDGTPDTAMQRLITSKTSEGQGRTMWNMVNLVKQDKTGEALSGLKTAFGQYLLKHAETTFGLLGSRYSKFLRDLSPAAKELFTPKELKRLRQIGSELEKIERMSAARAAKGGVISDAPNKIIQILGGTIAARLGAKAGAGTSGASLRTASIFTKEFNKYLGKLTTDGAEELLLKAVEDEDVFKLLMKTASEAELPEINETLGRVLSKHAFVGGQVASQYGDAENAEDVEIRQMQEALRQQGM